MSRRCGFTYVGKEVKQRPLLGVREEGIALVLELHGNGLGEQRIGERLGVGQTAVRTALRQAICIGRSSSNA